MKYFENYSILKNIFLIFIFIFITKNIFNNTTCNNNMCSNASNSNLIKNISLIIIILGIILLTIYITKAYSNNLEYSYKTCKKYISDTDSELQNYYSHRPTKIFSQMFEQPSTWMGYSDINSKYMKEKYTVIN